MTVFARYKDNNKTAAFYITARTVPVIVGLNTAQLNLLNFNMVVKFKKKNTLCRETQNQSFKLKSGTATIRDMQDLIAKYLECFNGPPVIHPPKESANPFERRHQENSSNIVVYEIPLLS